MKKFLLWCVLHLALSLCSCDHHRHPPPPNRGFRPVPPPGYRPSFGPPLGSIRPCCGPPRGGYNRPSSRPPVDSYRPYWPKNPNQGNYNDYLSQGPKDDNQFQSLGLGNPSTAEVTVSSYFPVSPDNQYTSPYDDHSYPSSNNGHTYHNHRRPPYKPAFRPSEQIYTGPDFLARPPTNMVPPVFSGQGPDYSSPMYSQTPPNMVPPAFSGQGPDYSSPMYSQTPPNPTPFFPNQPIDYSPSTSSNQLPENLAPIFSNLPQDVPSFANQPNQNLDQIVLNQPQDASTTTSPPADLAPIFDFSSAIIAPNPPIDFDPIFPDGPSISSPTDYWLPSASIPSQATSTTTLPPFRMSMVTSTTTYPPFRLFSMNSTTTNPPLRLFSMHTTTTSYPPLRFLPMHPTTTTSYPPLRLFSMNTTKTTTNPPFRLLPMHAIIPMNPPRLFSINSMTTTSRAPARTFPPTVAPTYNNSLAINNVSVVVADDDVFDRIFLDNNNCSNVFPLTESDELLLSFSFAANLTGRCVLTFTGPSEGLKVALQISNVTLMKDNGTKVDCEKQSLGVFSHKAGNLFKMEQLCGLERNSAILLTDSQSPLITLNFVNQPPAQKNTTPFAVTFNMQLFTYTLQNNVTSWP